MFRSLLALADSEACDAQTLSFAAALARDHRAAVRIFPAMDDMASDLVAMGLALGAPYTPEVDLALRDSREDRLLKIRQNWRAACMASGLPFGDPDAAPGMALADVGGAASWIALTALANLSDLVVVGQDFLVSKTHLDGVLNELLLSLRIPVFIGRGEPDAFEDKIAIAWDGSREAARAVRAAIPLLARARTLVVIQHRPGLAPLEVDPDTAPLVRYLGLHGIGRPELHLVDAGAEGAAIIADAGGFGASTLVAGAYDHSPLREAVFGGATRSFLAANSGPSLFLAH